MNGSTSIQLSLMPPMPSLSSIPSSSPRRFRAHAPASKRVASTSLPSTFPNSKKPNPASPVPVFFSQTQIPPAYEPTPMKSCCQCSDPLHGTGVSPANCSPGLTGNLWKGQGDRLQHLRPHLQNFPSLPSSPVLFFLSQCCLSPPSELRPSRPCRLPRLRLRRLFPLPARGETASELAKSFQPTARSEHGE